MAFRRNSAAALGIIILSVGAMLTAQQPSDKSKDKKSGNDQTLVERLLAARREYHESLQAVRAHYITVGDMERARWAEEELLQYHRIAKPAYNLLLDVPPKEMQALHNIPEANELYRQAMQFKDKGYGQEYTDNQRRAELLFQRLLTKYPQSDKISDTAYQLGDLYESKAYKQYARAAMYYERCFQWDSKTHFDARMRAATLYERQLNERNRAIEIYREITTHEVDQKRVEEATRRLTNLRGMK